MRVERQGDGTTIVCNKVASEIRLLDKNGDLSGLETTVIVVIGIIVEVLGDLRVIGDHKDTRIGYDLSVVEIEKCDRVSEPKELAMNHVHEPSSWHCRPFCGQLGIGEIDSTASLAHLGAENDNSTQQ